MQVSKWGDSLAVRLPKALVDELGLVAGDELNVVEASNGARRRERKTRRKAALDRLASLNWTLPPITNSIGTRPTSGEGVFRYQHSRLRRDSDRQTQNGAGSAYADGGVISVQVLNEFIHVARRKLRARLAADRARAGCFAPRSTRSCR